MNRTSQNDLTAHIVQFICSPKISLGRGLNNVFVQKAGLFMVCVKIEPDMDGSVEDRAEINCCIAFHSLLHLLSLCPTSPRKGNVDVF